MGGAGFIFTGENDADIMHNSASINLNLLEEQKKWNKDKKVQIIQRYSIVVLRVCTQNTTN